MWAYQLTETKESYNSINDDDYGCHTEVVDQFKNLERILNRHFDICQFDAVQCAAPILNNSVIAIARGVELHFCNNENAPSRLILCFDDRFVTTKEWSEFMHELRSQVELVVPTFNWVNSYVHPSNI